MSNLSAFCGEARTAKGNAEKFSWTVSPNELTHCYQGYKKRINDDANRHDTANNNNNNNKKNKGDKRNQTDLRGSSQTTSQSGNDDLRCNVCNRIRHSGNSCPYYSWHPNANKDSKVPFESSKADMAYVAAHTKHHKYLDSNDTDGNPLKNVPRDFKQPDAPKSKPASSTSSGQSNKNKKKGKFSHDKHSVALSSYFANLLPAIDSSDISNTLISCTAFLIQTIKSKRGLSTL